ncbi:MAG TPA: 4-(cytidine 5'-diphospho)-2-C-methyl-D-erythritol kinase [Candidatus Binataceae bacterium]|nr:4-(cytidine 5'-diphospho)-2-C-methyl-D-erythritol kinase [Candidatus Binataceae bacterium]
MVKLLRSFAPAKINLFLRVTGRRADAYHELDSIFVPVSIYDRVDIELHRSHTASVQLRCDSDSIPADERNLAFRAASEFLSRFVIRAEVGITLHKAIPVGAGLGGGSSDAGTVLGMMAGLCGIADLQPLVSVAERLGADVPFFLNPQPSRVRGIGEQIEALPLTTQPIFLIAVPPIEVSTALVFRDLHPDQWSGPASDEAIAAVVQGQFEREYLVNDLEQIAVARWPEIGELKRMLGDLGARATAMTGSGGGVFGVFDSTEQAERVRREIDHTVAQVQTFIASVHDSYGWGKGLP